MFKRAALAAIHWYWRVIREEDRRVCLYRVSCSRHVHAIMEKDGMIAGLRAFSQRMRSCKPGYRIERKDSDFRIHTVNGRVIVPDEMNPLLRGELSHQSLGSRQESTLP